MTSMLILVLFVVMNLVFAIAFLVIMQNHTIDTDTEIAKIAEGISQNTQGQIQANDRTKKLLTEKNSWAMVLDKDGTVIWEYDMPENLPKYYSVLDVAKFSRWYLEEYPVLVQELNCGLLVVGYQPNDVFGISMVKIYYVTDSKFINTVIIGGILLLFMNILLVVLLFWNNARKVEKSVMPIIQGIEDFSHGRNVLLPETGEFADVNIELNHAGQYMLKRDRARAEWINGVSHDVRTPLSIIMGYSGAMEDDDLLPDETRKQAGTIRSQTEKLKCLIADLNLTSKLEYSMQPLKLEDVDAVELVRQVISDFLNDNLEKKYQIDFDISAVSREMLMMRGDKALLKRMLTNLIQNCISHNQNGCDVILALQNTPEKIVYVVSDNGIGISNDQLEQLNKGITSDGDYLESGETVHGFGLKLVKQIVEAHRGKVAFKANKPSGLCVEISLYYDAGLKNL